MTNDKEMSYAQISGALIQHLPELHGAYQALLEWWEDEVPGPHIVYGDILNPYIDQLLAVDDDRNLQRTFGFLETLATSRDVDVRGVLAVTVLEYLGGDRKKLRRAETFMRPATLMLSRDVERFWGHQDRSSC